MRAQVDELKRRVSSLEEELRENRPVLLANEIKNLDRKLDEQSEDIKGLKRAFITGMVGFTSSALILALTIALAFGGK